MKEHLDFNPLDYYNQALTIFWSGALPSTILCTCRWSELGFEQCRRHSSHLEYAHNAALGACHFDFEYEDLLDRLAPVEYHEVTSEFQSILAADDPMHYDSIQAALHRYVRSNINSYTED